MLSEEEKNMKNDILFQIDMQLYDEFNDEIATMYDHLEDIYSLKDIEEVEKAEKDKEIKLLREAIKKQQAEIEKKDNTIKSKDKEIKPLKEFHNKHIKIIDKMAEQLAGLTIWNIEKDEPLILTDKQEVIDYFTKVIEEE